MREGDCGVSGDQEGDRGSVQACVGMQIKGTRVAGGGGGERMGVDLVTLLVVVRSSSGSRGCRR